MRYLFIFENYKDVLGDFSFLRKEPKYINFFKKLMEKDNSLTIDKVEEIYNELRIHRNTIKQNNIDILSLENTEQIEDVIQEIILIEKLNKFIKLLPNRLRNELKRDNDKLIKFKNAIIDFDYNEYKNIFLKKVIKYKSVDELLKAINNYLSTNNITIHELVDDIEDTNGIEVFNIIDDMVIAIVYDRKASCKFGSQQWCISGNGGGHWDTYVPNKLGVQYFIWDYSKEETDALSKIGISLYEHGKYVAFDKSDRKIDHLDKVLSDDILNSLLNIYELDKYQMEKYILYNIEALMGSTDINISKRINDIMDSDFKMKIFYNNPEGYIKLFKNIDDISDNDLLEVLDKNPSIFSLSVVNKRLPKDFVRDFVIKHPSQVKYVDKSHFDDLSIEDYMDMLSRYSEYIDDTIKNNRDNYNRDVNIFGLRADIKEVNNKLFKDPDFIEELFMSYPDTAIRYFPDCLRVLEPSVINDMYRNNKDTWDEVLNSNKGGYKPNIFMKGLKKYFSNEITMRNFDTMNFVIFNAGYDRKKVGENPKTGKSLYEEVLNVENFVNYNPFELDSPIIKMMKLRATTQGDIKTYGIWIEKDAIDVEDMRDMSEEEWFLDLIDSRKIPL